mmetsp:Transcript_3516/g.6621  ORF Transcript_3516/g.6621 Transcript_3516/m.6621 type:complete len:91 (+) Transcript_3516:122-394(+)
MKRRRVMTLQSEMEKKRRRAWRKMVAEHQLRLETEEYNERLLRRNHELEHENERLREMNMELNMELSFRVERRRREEPRPMMVEIEVVPF